MYILDKLWDGIDPSAQMVSRDAQYLELLHRLSDLGEALYAELPETGRDLYQDFRNTQAELTEIELRDAFTRGVRLGAGVILDITGA